MKYAINQLDAVRGYYDAMGAKPRIRFYADGKEVAKALATEFSVTGADVEYVAPKAKKTATKRTEPTKADRLREQIMLAVQGQFEWDELVDWAVTNLEFKRPLARQYVKNLTEELTQHS